MQQLLGEQLCPCQSSLTVGLMLAPMSPSTRVGTQPVGASYRRRLRVPSRCFCLFACLSFSSLSPESDPTSAGTYLYLALPHLPPSQTIHQWGVGWVPDKTFSWHLCAGGFLSFSVRSHWFSEGHPGPSCTEHRQLGSGRSWWLSDQLGSQTTLGLRPASGLPGRVAWADCVTSAKLSVLGRIVTPAYQSSAVQ